MVYPWLIEVWKGLEKQSDRLPHALLIHGPQGIGKLALAEQWVKRLLCEAKAERPCGRCDACRWYEAGSHPDFRRLEPEALARHPEVADEDAVAERPARSAKPSTEIKVDQVRELDAFLNLRSHREGARVVLVHPAEDLNVNAANALLKALEEPPGDARFVLVSHRPARLLPTLRSRCVPVPVAVPDRAVAEGWLKAQGVEEAQQWLALASGAPLRALTYAGEVGSGLVGKYRAIAAGKAESVAATTYDREQLEELAEVLQRYAHDKALVSYTGRASFGDAAPSRNPQAWLRYARLMGEYRVLTRHPLNPRLFAGEMIRQMPED